MPRISFDSTSVWNPDISNSTVVSPSNGISILSAVFSFSSIGSNSSLGMKLFPLTDCSQPGSSKARSSYIWKLFPGMLLGRATTFLLLILTVWWKFTFVRPVSQLATSETLTRSTSWPGINSFRWPSWVFPKCAPVDCADDWLEVWFP